MRATVVLVLFLLCVVGANATDYYVKNGGNDNLDGLSDANAWATLAKVSQKTFSPGDRILLKCGSSWNYRLLLYGNGTADNRITLTSYGSGNQPKIYRSDTTQDECIYGYAINYWTINNLRLETALFGIHIAGSAEGGNTYGITVTDCYFYDMNYLSPKSQQGVVNGIGIYIHDDYQFDHVFTGCTFDTVQTGIQCWPSIETTNVYAANCTAMYGYGCAMSATCMTYSTIENWTVHDIGYGATPNWMGTTAFGGYWNTHHVTWRNNVIWNVHQGQDPDTGQVIDGCGMDFDLDTNNCTFENNIVAHCDGPAIEILGVDSSDDQNMTIRNNLFYNNCRGNQDISRRYEIWNCNNPSATGTISNNGFYKNSIAVGAMSGNLDNVTKTGNLDKAYLGSGWDPIFGEMTKIDNGGSGYIWGINSGTPYQWTGGQFYPCWSQKTGALKQLGVGNDGTVWGTNSSDQIYKWNGSSWVLQTGTMDQVDCGSSGNIWAVNDGQSIYKWNGSGWDQKAGALKQVSAGVTSPYAWGVNSSNSIYRWDGSSWNQTNGGLTQVSACDYNKAVGISSVNGSPYVTTNGGTSWTQLPGSPVQVSYGNDGAYILGLASDGGIWFRQAP